MPLHEEFKAAIDSFQKEFKTFKDENDTRLKAVEGKKGTAESEEKLEKMDSSMVALEKTVEKLQLAHNKKSVDTTEAIKETAVKASEAVKSYFRTGKTSQEEEANYVKHLENVKAGYKTLSVHSEADGGFLVRPEVSANITNQLFESSPMRQLADSMTIGTDAFEEPYSDDEADAGWVGETQPRGVTGNATLKMIRIPVHEMYANPELTQKIVDDSAIDIEAWHQNKVSEKFGRIEETSFFAGNGILKPKGILGYAAGDGFDKIEQLNSGAAGAFDGDDLMDLQNKLLESFQMNATWMMQRATAGVARKLKDTDGRYLFSIDPEAGLNANRSFLLLGRPLRYANDMQAVAANALSIAYGDFKAGYLIVDRIGVRVLRDNLTKKGFVQYYTTKRVGGGVRQFQAFKLLKLA